MKAKRWIILIVSSYLLVSGVISGYYWYEAETYVKTDNANTMVDYSVLAAPVTGRILNLGIRENQPVEANEIIGFIQAGPLSNAPGSRIPLRAPTSGRVIRMGVHNQEVVTSGQNLLAIAKLDTTYVEARLTEQEVGRVHVGQTVDVTLDTNGGTEYKGIVSKIDEVTVKEIWPIISLTPARQQPREEQLVPVRIQVKDVPLLPGTNAEVAIHVRGNADGLF